MKYYIVLFPYLKDTFLFCFSEPFYCIRVVFPQCQGAVCLNDSGLAVTMKEKQRMAMDWDCVKVG